MPRLLVELRRCSCRRSASSCAIPKLATVELDELEAVEVVGDDLLLLWLSVALANGSKMPYEPRGSAPAMR